MASDFVLKSSRREFNGELFSPHFTVPTPVKVHVLLSTFQFLFTALTHEAIILPASGSTPAGFMDAFARTAAT